MPVIDVKQAIEHAKRYASDVLGISDLLLEEVHSSPNRFEITLSFPARMNGRNFMLGNDRREYKSFEINKESGEVEGMSIREIA